MKQPDRRDATHAWLVHIATEQVHLVRAKDLRACCWPGWKKGRAADWVADAAPDLTRLCSVCHAWLLHYQDRKRSEHGLKRLR